MDTQRIEELVDLKGKAAVVTGGGTGIGQAVAMALADVGAAVMIADRNLDAAYRTVGEIRELGGYAEAMQADACSAEDAQRVAARAVERFGGLDILVNAAATFSFSTELPQIQDLWSKTLSAHTKGVFFYSQAAAQRMIEAGRGGRIVNVASMEAMNHVGHPSNSTANNVAQLTKALAVEYGSYQISVNAVAPSMIKTQSLQAQVASLRPEPTLVEARYAQREAQVERTIDVGEIATVVLFLASDAGGQVTGNLVVID